MSLIHGLGQPARTRTMAVFSMPSFTAISWSVRQNRQLHACHSAQAGDWSSKIQAVVYTNGLPVHLGLTPGDTRQNLSGMTDSFVTLPVRRKLHSNHCSGKKLGQSPYLYK
jgi:hypothetical protein